MFPSESVIPTFCPRRVTAAGAWVMFFWSRAKGVAAPLSDVDPILGPHTFSQDGCFNLELADPQEP